MSYLPTPPKADGYGNRGLRVLLGIGGGLRITTDDDASSPTLRFFMTKFKK